MIRLRVNGRGVDLEAEMPLLAYLEQLGVDPRAVAVEVNERILDRAEFGRTTLRDGDVVEVVRMVGGGRLQGNGPPHCRSWARASTPPAPAESPPPPPPARPRAHVRRL